MKKYILIFSAMLLMLSLCLNGCAVYIIKCDCPPRDTVIIKEQYPTWDFTIPKAVPMPLPYLPNGQDSVWIDLLGDGVPFKTNVTSDYSD